MGNCSHKKNPLKRNGISRNERALPGLQNGYVQIDEKSFADWIVFAKGFSEYVNYYDLNGTIKGNWAPFFSNDVSAVAGTIAVQSVDGYRLEIRERLDFLKDDDNAAQLAAARKKLHEIFSLAFSFCRSLDVLYALLPEDDSFKNDIENIVLQRLSPQLNNLIRYYKAADNLGYLAGPDLQNIKVLGYPAKSASAILNMNFTGMWWSGISAATTWKDYVDDLQPDAGVFGEGLPDAYFSDMYGLDPAAITDDWKQFAKINHAANHNLFTGVFDSFLMAFSKLVKAAEERLLNNLANDNTHQPHYTLFLTFLHLFRYAQKDLNTLTTRHLNFYYKDVLRLYRKKPVPNKVHLLAELAKPVAEHVLAEDTLFKAGKDSLGKEVLYELEQGTSFNKAQVVSLKAVYLADFATATPATQKFEGRLFASPVMNSADGLGAELTSENKEWHPFANTIYLDGDLNTIQMPRAEIGFAIASHYLYMQEGRRKIMLRLATDNDDALKGKSFNVFVTTKKGWYQVSDVTVNVANKLNRGTQKCAEVSFTMNGEEPAIVNYDSKVHGDNFDVKVPVVKVMLANNFESEYEYEKLRDIQILKFEVAVEAGRQTSGYDNSGLKQLFVSTDAGPVDTSKPFQPFGAQPQKGAGLVVGSSEAFSKKNINLSLNIEWANLPKDKLDIAYNSATPTVNCDFLQGGVWASGGSGFNDIAIFDDNRPAAFDSLRRKRAAMKALRNSNSSFAAIENIKLPSAAIFDFESDYTGYDSKSTNGYLRLELNDDFGHKEYQTKLTTHLINSAKGDAPATPFNKAEPYTPLIQSLYLSYTAFSDVIDVRQKTTSTLPEKDAFLFQLYPFGYIKHDVGATQFLFPQFYHTDADGRIVQHSGEFYIGFENLFPRQAVNVLFQVLDGTADPTLSKPEDHIQWSYLAGDEWRNFKRGEINDNTAQLIRSGIISFAIPAGATTANNVLPAGLLWLRAAISEKAEAVCKLLSVKAQAATVVFDDNENAADFLNLPLPAETISKLKLPQSAVKKIVQPYPSFGGRPMENEDAYYMRVSERLRHKARAITIWDYEHLILEAFPAVHKVKCLNHTKSADDYYNETLPGHVTIITIPDLKQRNDANPLKPYTSQAVLKAIEVFLKKIISCHVKLHVVNPVFEEVRLTFKLRLAPGYNDFTIYSNQLKQEITGFLSPWAHSNEVEINFGGTIHKSVLINFIEERSYVDFITDVELCHFGSDGTIISPDTDEVIATTAKSILISVQPPKHTIIEIPLSETVVITECIDNNEQSMEG